MSDIWKLIADKERTKKTMLVRDPKHIRFYFCDGKGDNIIEGYATNVDVSKLDFINNYVGYYHAFENGGFGMLKIDLEREFAKIGAVLGFVEERLGMLKYGSELDEVTLESFRYKVIEYEKN